MYIAALGNTDVFEALTCIATFFISGRALLLYAQLRGSRLFILGLSMGLFFLTTLAGIVHNLHVVPIPFNTTWFSFAGQTAAFLFIFLGAVRGTDEYLRNLIRWQLVLSGLIFLLLLLSSVLPDVTSTLMKALFIGSRGVACFLTFYCYVVLFMKKETRFSLVMSLAFFCLSFGYILIIPRFFLAHADMLTLVGDVLRVIGLAALAFGLLGG
jgi:hypothetical protein